MVACVVGPRTRWSSEREKSKTLLNGDRSLELKLESDKDGGSRGTRQRMVDSGDRTIIVEFQWRRDENG